MAERRNWIERTRSTFKQMELLNRTNPIGYCILDLPNFPRHASEILRYRERLADRTYTNSLSMYLAMWVDKSKANPWLMLLPTGALKFISFFESYQKVDF